MLGLKRGTVILCSHEKEWEYNAACTAGILKDILKETACDIQHIGSTAINYIKAKPIIDLAVAVRSFEEVSPYIPALAENGFIHRNHEIENDMLFVRGDFENDTRTHHIHFVKYGSMEWINYICFRDYLNANPAKAYEYEKLKVNLLNLNSGDRAAYTAGKAEFISYTLRKALVWSYLGRNVYIKIDRPIGTAHPKHPDIIYPVNYGYIPGVSGGDGEELDVYVLGVDYPVSDFNGRIIGIIHRENDIEDKLVAAPDGLILNQSQITEAVYFQEQFYKSRTEAIYHKSCGIIIYRNNSGITEFLLLLQTGSKTWSFPKGHSESGESELQTALRETYEETGITAEPDGNFREEAVYRIGPPLDTKTVVLFLAEINGPVKIKADEIIEFRWVGAEEAKALLVPEYSAAVTKAEKFIGDAAGL